MTDDYSLREHKGRFGTAVLLDLAALPNNSETVCAWLCTLPPWHPAWSQYALMVARLRDVDGLPPPVLQFPGATHELLLVSIDPTTTGQPDPPGLPDLRAHDPASFAAAMHDTRRGVWLSPVNVAWQMTGTDDEAARLAWLAARALCHGHLEPESSNGAERIRAAWAGSMTKTLAHVRGEPHEP